MKINKDKINYYIIEKKGRIEREKERKMKELRKEKIDEKILKKVRKING